MSKNTNLSFLTDYITADITNGRIGINNASPTVAFDVSGATKISGALTLTSTISNGTYTYTLPSATGTLALTSALSSYLQLTGGTLTGALSGTTATFSGELSTTSGLISISGGGGAPPTGGVGFRTVTGRLIVYGGTSDITFQKNSNAGPNLTILESGAATFSSSVSATSLRSSAVGTFGFNTANNGEFQIYATAADGLVMAGRGSTNDFVLVNKTGSNVFEVPTGTINTYFRGNVGIGTSSPVEKFSVITGTNYAASFNTFSTADTTTRISLGGYTTGAGGSGGSAAIGAAHNHSATAQSSLIFYTHDGSALNERMRITSGGNLLVGTTTDSGSLITASSYSTSSKSKISENATTVAANTATTIFTKPAGNGGAFVLVTGRTAANNWFFDTVVFNSYNSASALSTNNGGSPPARSYSVSADSLQVTVPTALDNIYCFGLSAKY